MSGNSKELKWLVEKGLKKAEFWEPDSKGNTICCLCPRSCVIGNESFGFCKSRFNKSGVLFTAIWGKLLMPSIEPIETEAVFHYWPGVKTLSIGNLGCNLECDFCQNWESSNLENISPDVVKYYKPREIIDLAKELDIKVIAFTYNDPVIWFEYVLETAILARKNGLKTLFKSAAFISPPAIQQLTEVIDIFSISLKSLNPRIFQSMSKGTLADVLNAIRIIHKSNSHLEISNLLVTDITDIPDEVRSLAQWIKEELSDSIPLHFVRFHPAYKYSNVNRTYINFLEEAREIAIDEGLKHVYIGNTYKEGHADQYCTKCNSLLVRRFGMSTKLEGISAEGHCSNCDAETSIELAPYHEKVKNNGDYSDCSYDSWDWLNTDIQTIHIELVNSSTKPDTIYCEHHLGDENIIHIEHYLIPAKTSLRIAIFKQTKEETKIVIFHPKGIECEIFELMDRAHFPIGRG